MVLYRSLYHVQYYKYLVDSQTLSYQTVNHPKCDDIQFSTKVKLNSKKFIKHVSFKNHRSYNEEAIMVNIHVILTGVP